MLLASLWAGTAMDHAGLGLIHALSGPLTGSLHLHHGLANGLILPHVLRFNLPSVAEERRRKLNGVFGLDSKATDETLVEAVIDFVAGIGLPAQLSELDVSLSGVDWEAISHDTLRMILVKNNPRPVTEADCQRLLAEMR